MAEPTIICPKCKNEIKLTESLAAPLIESTRRHFEQRLTQKDLDVTGREKAIQDREAALSKAKDSLETQVAERVQLERGKIAADEAKKARLALSNDLNQKTKEVADLQEILKQKDEKLTEAQKVQADLLKQKRELDDAKRELDLTVEKRVQENLTTTRQQARKEAEDEMRLKVSEKEQTITSMQKQIEDLKRRAEQGSQQLQGEVQELELKPCSKQNFRMTRFRRWQKASMAATCCSGSSVRSGRPADQSYGNPSEPKTGATAGWQNSETISGRPRRKLLSSSVMCWPRAWKPSAWSRGFGSHYRRRQFQLPWCCASR